MASRTEALRAACGEPVFSGELSAQELDTAYDEGRVLTVVAYMATAIYHLVPAGQKATWRHPRDLIVYQRPIPFELRTGSGDDQEPPERWETEQAAHVAFRLAGFAPPIPPVGPAPLPRELIRAIAARPDDAAPRLVAADALLTQGEARGELIQLEHRLLGAELDAPTRSAMRERVARLQQEHLPRWRAEHGLVGRPFTFHRGFFVGTSASPGTGGLAALEAVLERSPIVELEVAGAALNELLDHSLLSQLRSLSIYRASATGEQLGRLPHTLRAFCLDGGGAVRVAELAAVVRAPFAQSLESLTVHGVGDLAADELLTAHLPGLRELRLPANLLRARLEPMRARFGRSWQQSKPST